MSKCLALDSGSGLKLELTVAQTLCEIIGSPRALAVFLMIKYEEFDQLIELEINPCNYQDHQHFADDYLVTVILSKSSQLPLKVDRKQKAVDAFYASELRCGTFNQSIDRKTFSLYHEKARRLIGKVLGPLRRLDLEFIESSFRFGPGATTGVPGSGSVLSDKYDEEIHLTSSLIPYYRAILGENWWSVKRSPTVVDGNKFANVPKNAKTDRGICIEPTLNIYGQLGIGALLRNKLKHLGIDLSTQSRNQFLASKAQERNLATIDLAAASDSLCWKAVMELFPSDWFELLDLFRSPCTSINGETVELEKFSSMGNGYTFELETLVFASVALSCVPFHDHHNVSVYGDDIIVPQYAAAMVIDTLEYLGFSVNKKKSFLAGNFFESCGTDWFNGQNVRPFYLRQEKGNRTPYPVQIANALRLYAQRRLGGLGCDARFRPLWLALEALAPITWRNCRIPASFGDTGIISSLSEARPPRARHGWEGWIVRHISMKPIRIRKNSYGRLLAALARPAPGVFTKGYEPRRGYLGKAVPKLTTCHMWSDDLDWV